MSSETKSPVQQTDGGFADRAATLASTYGVYVETLLATAITVLLPLGLVVMFFGIIAGMPMGSPPESGDPNGANTILLVAMVMLGVAVLSSLALAVTLLVHAPADAWVRTDRFEDTDLLGERPVRAAGYWILRVVATVSALACLGSIVLGLVLGISYSSIDPDAVPIAALVYVGAVVGMLVTVYADALRGGISFLVDDEAESQAAQSS